MRSKPSPSEVPGYEILGFLGRGGMGSVWKARRPDGTFAAVKVLDLPKEKLRPTFRQFFRREAVAMLNLRHPALVRGLDVGDLEDGRPFMAMEFIEGENLWKRIKKRGPAGEMEVCSIGMTVASGLDHAHKLGVLHMDIKPENVMLVRGGGVKLVDFGLIVPTDDDKRLICGTPGYASPEALSGKPVGPASDLYSLGLTLAAAVLGRPPFEDENERALILLSMGKQLLLPPRIGDSVITEGFRAVIERLCRKDPRERYGSAAEIVLDLESVAARDRPLGAFLGMRGIRLALRRRRVRMTAVAVMVLPAAATVLAAFSGGRKAKTVVVETPVL